MFFTDIFIKRPVLASVISLLIFLLGLKALYELPLRQFPKMENTVITITTAYPGADAALVQGFVTTRIQNAVASAEGIDYMSSISNQGISQIQVHIRLDYDADKAFTQIMSNVASVRAQLPRNSEAPSITKETGSGVSLMYLAFDSSSMNPQQITDYLMRVVQPELETLPGIAKVHILGGSSFAMRIALDPQKMAALGVTPDQVSTALRENHFLSAPGALKGQYTYATLRAGTDMHHAKDFARMVVVKRGSGNFVRLHDIARVYLGPENTNTEVVFNGKHATFMAIDPTPEANALSAIQSVKARLPLLQERFPPTLEVNIAYDATEYIRSALWEVLRTIVEAILIVVFVIYCSLGALRAAFIPIITIPLSLVGVASLMRYLGYSLNVMTLLAMVLAIGLVVDDAIVVLENIERHRVAGADAVTAALKGAREIAWPIVSMTLTLMAVYAPIGFLGGVTGNLFREFAFTLASAVLISGVVALTLSPMLCQRILPHSASEDTGRLEAWMQQRFEQLSAAYQRLLHRVLAYRPLVLLTLCVFIGLSFYLYTHTQDELAPPEDKGVIFSVLQGPEYANIDYMKKYTPLLKDIVHGVPEVRQYFSVVGGQGAVNTAFAGFLLSPSDQRTRTQAQIQPQVQQALNGIAGLQASAFGLPPIPSAGGQLPIQFILKTTGDFHHLDTAAHALLAAAQNSHLFIFVRSSLRLNRPQIEIDINRDKAAHLGISMEQIGAALSGAFAEYDVNRFAMQGRSYKVIPLLERTFRFNPKDIEALYVKTQEGVLVPLAHIITVHTSVQPNQLEQFQQLNSVTLSGVMQPGRTIAEGLALLKEKAEELLPDQIHYDYAGQSRQYITEGNSLMFTFFFALIVVFLVLAAQFESFRDPWIILAAIPLSACGALIPMNLGAGTVNIYSQVGLVTLIGLISKHGILMVAFANQLRAQDSAMTRRSAVEQAAAIRLRPILMTTAATVMGVLPLMLVGGAGAASRWSMGLVIVAGMLFGTLCTLLIVPAVYTYLSHPVIAKRRGA